MISEEIWNFIDNNNKIGNEKKLNVKNLGTVMYWGSKIYFVVTGNARLGEMLY